MCVVLQKRGNGQPFHLPRIQISFPYRLVVGREYKYELLNSRFDISVINVSFWLVVAFCGYPI